MIILEMNFSIEPYITKYFITTLLASWTVMSGSKLLEGRRVDPTARRVGQMILGALIGVASQILAGWMIIDPSTAAEPTLRFVWFDRSWVPQGMPGLVGYAAYFGLVGLAIDWWTMTDRDRRRWFRVVPLIKTGILALIPAAFILPPQTHPYAVPMVVLTSAVVQLASPWNEAAARYAVFAQKQAKKQRSVA